MNIVKGQGCFQIVGASITSLLAFLPVLSNLSMQLEGSLCIIVDSRQVPELVAYPQREVTPRKFITKKTQPSAATRD
ncbi:uncharacterized protein BDV14DRAFT_167866 [Aspergillus stella-maris]|uniref:uncharacterized protein n=1 Tax=Aspergillus stella-maris TaxID=1810926 RepID=UPI003CCD4034